MLINKFASAVVSEWLRRWTRNPLGSARTGSNPVYSVSNFVKFSLGSKKLGRYISYNIQMTRFNSIRIEN